MTRRQLILLAWQVIIRWALMQVIRLVHVVK